MLGCTGPKQRQSIFQRRCLLAKKVQTPRYVASKFATAVALDPRPTVSDQHSFVVHIGGNTDLRKRVRPLPLSAPVLVWTLFSISFRVKSVPKVDTIIHFHYGLMAPRFWDSELSVQR